MRTLTALLALLLASPAYPDAPPAQVSSTEAAFASRFLPTFIRGYMSLRRGDKSQAQRAIAAGRAQNFHEALTSPLGGCTMSVPGLKGEHTFRWLWQALEESVDPQRDFS